MLMSLVLWILRKSLNRLSQYHLEVQLDLKTSGVSSLIQHSSDDRDASMMQNVLSHPYFLLHRSLQSCFWLSPDSTPKFSQVFLFFWSTAAFAAGIFIAWGTGINLCTKVQWCREFITPFSCHMVFVTLECNSFHTLSLGFLCFQDTRKFWLVIIILATGCSVPAIVLSQGIAGAAGTSNFSVHSWWSPWISLSSGSMK